MKLPTEITITLTDEDDIDDEDLYEEIAEYVSNKISDMQGFCHKGFHLSVTFTVSQILWDTDED